MKTIAERAEALFDSWDNRTITREEIAAALEAAALCERGECEKIAEDYRRRAIDSGIPQVILLGGAAQIIRNAIRDRARR